MEKEIDENDEPDGNDIGMTPLKSEQLYGTWAPLLLPIRRNDEIDYDAMEETIDIIISAKVNGIYSNGTAGEFYAQTEEEFERIQVLLAEKCNAAKMPFQIGCSHPVPQVTMARIKRSIALRPSAIQVILPDWCPPSIEEVIGFLRRITEAAHPVGVVLYNPPHAKVVLRPDDYRRLRESGIRLLGCKVADSDYVWYAAMRKADPELAVFVPGHRLATGIVSGASGSYSNVACLNPRVAQQWYELILSDVPAALALEKRICTFISDHILPYITKQGFSSAAIDKFLTEVGGWSKIGTCVRWPYKSIPVEEAAWVRDIARQHLPEFFESQFASKITP